MAERVSEVDDLGRRVEIDHVPKRIISLVPSWTETLFALGLGREVVGVTKFCVEPAAALASVTRVGGTRNPDLDVIAGTEPDLVIANAEENRREDVEHLRSRGIPVFTTFPKSVAGAVESILKLGVVLARRTEAETLVRRITLAVSGIEARLGMWSKLRLRVFCPVWKNPWMSFNADTYAHDVLHTLGLDNVFASAGERYPRATLEEALERRPAIVMLPDEPYEFVAEDVAALKMSLPVDLSRRVVLVNGRDLHWYGVHMVGGLTALAERVARIRASMI